MRSQAVAETVPKQSGRACKCKTFQAAVGIGALSEIAGASYWRRERVFENDDCLQACSFAKATTLSSQANGQ